LVRLRGRAGPHRLRLMCSERDPLDCHRCLLVARALAARGVAVGHILHDGRIESHAATERRLLECAGEDSDLFVTGQDERLAAAYRRRARAVAYRLKAAKQGAGQDGEQKVDSHSQEESLMHAAARLTAVLFLAAT